MGAIVGAITGIALVRLLPERGMEGCLDDGLGRRIPVTANR
jgi:hypothetical protein